MKKRIIIGFTTILILEIFTSYLRAWEQMLLEDTLISFLLFLIATVFLIKWLGYSIRESLLILCVSLLGLIILSAIIDWRLPNVGLPNIFMQFLGILFGCWLTQKNKLPAIAGSLFFCILCIWYIKTGYKYWFNFISHETFTGAISDKNNNNWFVTTEKNETIQASSFDNDIVILDFWSTGCVACYQSFPMVDSLYNVLKDCPNVQFRSVNIPLDGDTIGQPFHIVREKYGFGFPVTIGNEELLRTFKVSGYPTVIVTQGKEVLFRGRIELIEQFLKDRLECI